MRKCITSLLTIALAAAALPIPAAAEEKSTELSAIEFTRQMGNGINLGNTMEACNSNDPGGGQATDVYETLWGQPVTTQEMVDGMKNMGFDTLRIPVAWMTNATTLAENGDSTINPDYLDRVKEIVGYALKNDMTVIVNDHWDGGWYGMFGSESEETRSLAMESYRNMWTQIAEAFSDVPQSLVFESANEELGSRFDENSAYCDDSVISYLDDDARYELCNEVNQVFVDSVRAAGGENENRFLLIAGYGTNIDQTCDDRFKMPEDSATDKLLISVHCYSPTTYCLANAAASATPWGLASHYEALEEELSKMTRFTEQGIGVVIGEYGALPGSDGLKESTVEYTRLFLNLCTKYDLANCLWDTSGLYLRSDLKAADEEIEKLFQEKRAAEDDRDYTDIVKEAAEEIAAAAALAPLAFDENALTVTDDTAIGWLMWNDGGYQVSYSVGDTYSPDSRTPGLEVTDVEITGPGTYTVGLDFTGTAQGYSASVAFTAVGIANGEILFPGYVIDIKNVEINGEKYNLKGRVYTTSDDSVCTRVNLFNEWVTAIPYETARVHGGSTAGITATPINRNDSVIAHIDSIYVTFEYGPKR